MKFAELCPGRLIKETHIKLQELILLPIELEDAQKYNLQSKA